MRAGGLIPADRPRPQSSPKPCRSLIVSIFIPMMQVQTFLNVLVNETNIAELHLQVRPEQPNCVACSSTRANGGRRAQHDRRPSWAFNACTLGQAVSGFRTKTTMGPSPSKHTCPSQQAFLWLARIAHNAHTTHIQQVGNFELKVRRNTGPSAAAVAAAAAAAPAPAAPVATAVVFAHPPAEPMKTLEESVDESLVPLLSPKVSSSSKQCGWAGAWALLRSSSEGGIGMGTCCPERLTAGGQGQGGRGQGQGGCRCRP